MNIRSLALLAALGLSACDSKSGDTGVADDTNTNTDDTSADDTAAGDGFTISGTAVGLDGTPAAEGLCAVAADPTPTLSGGDFDVLGSTTVAADGSYAIDGISTNSTVGLMLLIQDCADEGTVLPTATGISEASYSSLGNGDTLDVTAYSIDATTQGAFSAGLSAAGYTGDLATDGAMLGFVFDNTGAPVDGATVSGSGTTTYYFTGADFSATTTVAAANAMFIIPGAGIGNYTCEADGYTFSSLLAGSVPGYALLVKFVAD